MPPPPLNQLVLTASIAQVQPLRTTPAGLPALDLQLEHESQQNDSGQLRQVKLLLKALAFGSLAERLARQELGSCWRFNGFLAAGRNGKSVVLHIQTIEPN